jgi:hypothetical protein
MVPQSDAKLHAQSHAELNAAPDSHRYGDGGAHQDANAKPYAS